MSFQKIELIGNLGRDPEMRYLPDGTAVTNLSIATNRRWTDRASGAPVEETAWFRVSVWGPQAESCNLYLAKGRQVHVEGRLQVDPATGGPRIWEREDGTAGAAFEIRASNVTFLGGRVESNPDEPTSSVNGSGPAPRPEEDEIPF